MTYKHHVIPFHEWKRRINPNATRYNRDFNAPDNVVWLTLEQHIEAHKRLAEGGSILDMIAAQAMGGQIGREEAHRLAVVSALKGKPKTSEHREKLRESLKGISLSPEHRKAMSDGWIGKVRNPHSLKTREKMSKMRRGSKRKPHSLETREKQSIAAKNRRKGR